MILNKIYKFLSICFFFSTPFGVVAQQSNAPQSPSPDPAPQEDKAEQKIILLPLPSSESTYGDGLARASTVIGDMNADFSEVDETKAVDDGKRGSDIIILPIPLSNPTYGTGLAVAGAMFYDIDASSQASVTGVGAFKTSNGSRGAGVYQKANFSENKFKVNAALAAARLHYEFFGVGNEAGDAASATPISEKKRSININATMRIMDGIYFGPKYRFVRSITSARMEEGAAVTALGVENDITVAGLGATLRYDARDNSFNPEKGWLAEFEFLKNDPAFGSDVKYDLVQANINYYHKLATNHVLATRLYVCSVSDGAPISELCQIGKKSDLRGYTGGQYRDTNMFAAQVEYRWQFHKKFGIVAFGGLGAVSSDLGSLLDNNILPSGGAGIRYLVSEEYKVNLSLDYAVGKNSQALYFRVGESF